MAKYRTALGRMVDMSELVARHEKTRAVGNMKVNARGDTIDAFGKIIEPVTSKVNSGYAKTVGNRAAQPVKSAAKPRRPGNDPTSPKKQIVVPPQPVPTPEPVELTEYEQELEAEFEDDLEIEQIKARENK